MAVRADDLALLDLGEDRLPLLLDERRADVEQLVAQMVEIEDHRVRLAAVDARVGLEELDQVQRALEAELLLLDPGLLDVSLTIRSVVLPAIRGPARPAVVIAPSRAFRAEVLDELLLAASTADMTDGIHERMFAPGADGPASSSIASAGLRGDGSVVLDQRRRGPRPEPVVAGPVERDDRSGQRAAQ